MECNIGVRIKARRGGPLSWEVLSPRAASAMQPSGGKLTNSVLNTSIAVGPVEHTNYSFARLLIRTYNTQCITVCITCTLRLENQLFYSVRKYLHTFRVQEGIIFPYFLEINGHQAEWAVKTHVAQSSRVW